MDTTFITIHDLSPEARILYSSDSIVDILGHTPDEVVNRSSWDFFHPDEVPVAKKLHSRGVQQDKAAVLSYCRIRDRAGNWVGCECCFSIVYDVMVCCISIYRNGMNSQKRAIDAPIIRKKFSSSPQDPRYHMLTHLSSKFTIGPEEQTHEPRAAFFLNRFTRTLTIMYATTGIEQVVGIPSDQMIGCSFYYCIAENCLRDAVDCLESAKGNDSIAYMRFFFQDPRENVPQPPASESEDEVMTDVMTSGDESDSTSGYGHSSTPGGRSSNSRSHRSVVLETMESSGSNGREDSGNSADRSNDYSDGGSSASPSLGSHSPYSQSHNEPIELEAVVSCTSDGLVVCLRRARPINPTVPPIQTNNNGMFAAPWAHQPMFLPPLPQQPPYPLGARHPAMAQAGPLPPAQSALMQTIRDVAVFAWALVGINGHLADYADSRSKPVGESQPPSGLRVWEPTENVREKHSLAPSGYASGSGSSSSHDPYGFGDPGLK